MSVRTQISRIKTAITAAYTAVANKGGTVPASKTVENLAAAIESITTGGGGGIAGVTELYSADDLSITYTSTSAGTAKTISGITDMKNYPLIVVLIENTNITAGSLKFIRSGTVLCNTKYGTSSVSIARYGTQQYYTSASALTNLASTTYGLWGYTYTAAGALTIRGRCNGSYYTSLTGTYKIRVLGVML